jgi:PST family polysaccharide transporter
MLLALAGNVVSARTLGPLDFGRFGLVMATVTVCGTLADAGLTYTAVKFIAQYEERDPQRAHAVARAYLAMRLLAGTLTALLGVLLSAPIAHFILGTSEAEAGMTPYLQIAFATLIGLAISSYPGTVLVALRRFGRLSVAAVLNAAITLAGILLLLAVGKLDLTTLIAWNVALPLVSTVPAWLMLPVRWRPLRRSPRASPGVMREMLGFSRWMWVSALGSIIAAQGDVLLLGRLAGPAAVGVYSVALVLAMRLDALNQSLLTVMLPRASRLQGPDEVRGYARRALGGSLALAGGLALLALAAQPLITLLYGERYTASAGLFLALLPVVLFDLATSSLFLLALPLNRPRVLAAADWLRVAILVVSGWLLIPRYAGYGAAIARLLSRFVGAAYTGYALRRAVRSAPSDPDPTEDELAAATRWAS